MTIRDRISKKFPSILSEVLVIVIVVNAIQVSSLFYSNGLYHLAAGSGEKAELFEVIEEFEEWAAETRKDALEEAYDEALETIEDAEFLIELARDEAESGNIDEAWKYLDQADEILNRVDAMLYGANEAVECIPAEDSDNVEQEPRDWKAVDSFAYQLQEINMQEMAETEFDLVIIDYSADGSDERRYSESQVRCLQDSEAGRRLALAYVSIGEAEDYRWYWQDGWDLDRDGIPDDDAPSWLGPSNPEWFGNYKVKYWDPSWKSIIFGYVDRAVEAGFDGIYLDIIDAYEYWGSDGESGLDRSSAEQDMVDFVIEIANYARETSDHPDFGVFPQNGDALASHPEYVQVVTGIGREDLWYLDNTPQTSSDIQEGITNLDKFKEAGKLVLVTDYPTDEDIIADFYSKAVLKGYIPHAAVRTLDKLIEKYPPAPESEDPEGMIEKVENRGEARPFTFTTVLDDNTFTISGKEVNATPTGLQINSEMSLHLTLNGKQGGYFEIILPKKMVSNITKIILAEGANIEFQVLTETDATTTIAFELPKDATSVDIIAETVVPEFLSSILIGAGAIGLSSALAFKFRRTWRLG